MSGRTVHRYLDGRTRSPLRRAHLTALALLTIPAGLAAQACFTSGDTYSVGSKPTLVATGELNGDGKQDLVAVNFAGNSVTILLGQGDGTFASGTSVGVGMGPVWVVVDDFNGDGKQDQIGRAHV